MLNFLYIYKHIYNYISDIHIQFQSGGVALFSHMQECSRQLEVHAYIRTYNNGPVDACIISFTARSTSLLELWWTVFGKVGPILAIKNQSGGGPLLYCQNWSWLHAAEKLSSALQLFYHSCMQLPIASVIVQS